MSKRLFLFTFSLIIMVVLIPLNSSWAIDDSISLTDTNAGEIKLGDYIFIELNTRNLFTNALSQTKTVKVENSSKGFYINVIVRETGIATNKYTGRFNLASLTNQLKNELRVSGGETITATYTTSSANLKVKTNEAPIGNSVTEDILADALYSVDLKTIFTDDFDTATKLSYAIDRHNGDAIVRLRDDSLEYTPTDADKGNTVIIGVKAEDTEKSSSEVVYITLNVIDEITIKSLTANGLSGTTTTTELTLDLEKDIELVENDLTLRGATLNAVTNNDDGTYTLDISDITVPNNNHISIKLDKTCYIFTRDYISVAVNVKTAKDPVVDMEVSASFLTGRNRLSVSTLSGTFKDANDDSRVIGDLNWTDNNQLVNNTGNYEWTFTPNDTSIYNTITGTTKVTLNLSSITTLLVSSSSKINLNRTNLEIESGMDINTLDALISSTDGSTYEIQNSNNSPAVIGNMLVQDDMKIVVTAEDNSTETYNITIVNTEYRDNVEVDIQGTSTTTNSVNVIINKPNALAGEKVTVNILNVAIGYNIDIMAQKSTDNTDVTITNLGENEYSFNMPGDNSKVDIVVKIEEISNYLVNISVQPNSLLVGHYLFELEDDSYTLGNFLIAASDVYNNGSRNEIYYYTGTAWYDLVKADQDDVGLDKSVQVSIEEINGSDNPLISHYNMEIVGSIK